MKIILIGGRSYADKLFKHRTEMLWIFIPHCDGNLVYTASALRQELF